MRLQKFVTTRARPSRDNANSLATARDELGGRANNANSLATARDERERDVMNEGRVVMRLQKFVTTRDTTVTGYGN